jgi:LmbE family N-acetylglucosaminyl deacetylase
VREVVFLADREPRLVDQELFRNLPLAFKELMHEVRQRRPEAILTLAYEGGHPDHDSCSVLAHEVGKTAERPTSAKSGQMCGTRDAWGSQIPVWECPIYRRNRTGLSVQEFIEPNGTEVLYVPTAAELERKQVMCLSYPSQGDFLKVFGLECEIFRPQKQYDYSRRPHEGKLNYELWQWKMTGDEVAEKLAEFQRERAWGFGERPASAN